VTDLALPCSMMVKACSGLTGIPEVTRIDYDLWVLRLSLQFERVDHPVYLSFNTPKGFRVLDDGDLLAFWNKDTRPEGWLWKVNSGGWFDLEKQRSGFVSGLVGGYSEYLVLGQNECVSVLTDGEPLIQDLYS
jgi:hypothetical protein